ncbi:IclR family transcriptional regulator [Blastococcus sp. SYSU DS0669]
MLAVLGAFSRDRPALTLSDISRAVGVPLSTAHRLVGELCAWGALERADDGRYRVGLRVWELGALAPRGLGLREAALPFMEDLYEVTHENVQLAVRDDVEVVFVERFAARDAVAVLTQVGGRFPLPPTGVGLVLLAHAPADVQERVLAGPLHRYTSHTVTNPRQLRRVLAEVRRAGVAVSDRQVTTDAVSVAAPIEVRGTVVAALSIVVRGNSPAAVRTLTPGVRAAARGISRTLDRAADPTGPGGRPVP